MFLINTTKQELDMWTSVGYKLMKVPNDYRSRYHTDYLAEVEGRINELTEALKLDPKDYIERIKWASSI
jgi:hypothetical protein